MNDIKNINTYLEKIINETDDPQLITHAKQWLEYDFGRLIEWRIDEPDFKYFHSNYEEEILSSYNRN